MSSVLHEQNQISQWLEEEAIARAASTKVSILLSEINILFVQSITLTTLGVSQKRTITHLFLRKSGIQIYTGPSKSQDRTGSSLRERIVL